MTIYIFLSTLELLTEKGHSDYNLIKPYYSNRNNIAHGGLLGSISMVKVFEDFKRLYKELATQAQAVNLVVSLS
ncbi:hypothetical protein BH23BAC3_BH23BAC3_24170 [soil metagenome]